MNTPANGHHKPEGVVRLCEFCIKHGEGKKWYEVMGNYSKELLSEPSRQRYIAHFAKNFRTHTGANVEKLAWSRRRMPLAYRFIRRIGTVNAKRYHFGQVVPLEDAEHIVEMVQSITRIPCICRSVTIGKNDARYCLLLGVDPTQSIKDWPELAASLEVLTRDEAKRLLREFDREGLVHSIWTFKTPFIGAICNCDHDCMAYKIQISNDLMNIMFKAEYLARIEPMTCIGCRGCQRHCQFGAVEYSIVDQKCSINPLKCYGCGVCRSVCKKGAIGLEDRTLPFAARVEI